MTGRRKAADGGRKTRAAARVPGRGHLALALAALLGLFWQSFVVQTHGWTEHRPLLQLSSGPTASDVRGDSPARLPDSCPICRELAHGGGYLAAGPITLPASTGQVVPAAETWSPVPAPRKGSHRWRSRAPPALPLA